jgi:hypothetical protein
MADRETADGLRSWARGAYAEEAGVELLVRAFDGYFADPEWPWIRSCERPGWFWVDTDAITAQSGVLSGGERRVLAFVSALIDGSSLHDVGGLVAGVDRLHLQLILAALAHAGGSHQHQGLVEDDGCLGLENLPALVAWPSKLLVRTA